MASPELEGAERILSIEERFQLLVESVQDYAIFMLDPGGHVSSWNLGAQALKGYREDEILGKHFSIFYPPEDVRAGKPQRELEVAAACGRVEDEGWRVRKDGSRFWANAVMTAVRDGGGRLVGFGKVTRDLTERRRAEEDRLKLAQANEAVRLRDEFVALAAHELRNPLNPLLMSLQQLERELKKSGAGERALSRVTLSMRQLGRLRRLAEELLDVSRIRSGELTLHRSAVDLAALVREQITRFEPEARAVGSELSLTADSTLPAWLDPLRIEQVVANLLSNAIKFGCGRPILMRLERTSKTVRLTVRDHGIGIAEEYQALIFERFRRVESQLRFAGLGLGLYLSRQIVNAHGGTIGVSSELGQGAELVVELPVDQQNLRTV
jgi:PAS domain S-box-containing protein